MVVPSAPGVVSVGIDSNFWTGFDCCAIDLHIVLGCYVNRPAYRLMKNAIQGDQKGATAARGDRAEFHFDSTTSNSKFVSTNGLGKWGRALNTLW
jgi:hypothetical protein